MRSTVIMALAVMMVLGASATFAEPPQRTYAGIGLLTVGDVEAALRDRVRLYIEEQYLVRPVDRRAVGETPESMEDLKQLLVKRIGPGDACLLAVAALPNVEHPGIIFKKERCGVVNVSALKPQEEMNDQSDELLGRRVEKESLRTIALIAGVPACPFLRCALLTHKNDHELDVKSRNPCPPCLATVREKIESMGLKLAKEAPPKTTADKPE